MMDWKNLPVQVVNTLVFTLLGLGFFMLSDWLVEWVMPRRVRKEIEEDQNIALAIVIASVILGIALIVSSAIRG